MATTVRVAESTRARAAALAAEDGASIGQIVEAALDAYEKSRFWQQTRAALAHQPEAHSADPAWEATTRDGLQRG